MFEEREGEYFLEKTLLPMQNNMTYKELSKFCFMGFLICELRKGLIESYSKELEPELAKLAQVKTQIEARRDILIVEEKLNELKVHEVISEFLTVEDIKEISTFTIGTLD